MIAQVHCGLVSIVPNSSVNQIVVFDDTTKYIGGITINSVTRDPSQSRRQNHCRSIMFLEFKNVL